MSRLRFQASRPLHQWSAFRLRIHCIATGGRLLLLGVMLSMAWAVPAAAIGPSWQLPAGSVDAVGEDRMWLFGRHASLRTFEAPGNIADVAVALLAQVSTPPRLQAMPDGLLIVGMDGEVHWLVRLIASGATRTQGSLSAIDLQRAPTLPALAWHPTGMAVRLDVAADAADVRIRQQILTDAGAVDAVHRRVCSALRQHGWRPDDTAVEMPCRTPPLAWPATGFWRRNDATLAVVIDRQPPGSSVFVMQTEPLGQRSFRLPWQSATRGPQERLGDTR